MRSKPLDIEKFKNWLLTNGAEILPLTNIYEELRFKAKETGVIYKSGKTNSPFTSFAIQCYKKGKKWSYGRPLSTGRQSNYKKEKIQLLNRDGDRCFYCGERLYDDISLEHLISLAAGGKNTLGNMVLAHEKCNQEAGNLSVYQKVEMAIKNRKK
jgi:hypothetical protein